LRAVAFFAGALRAAVFFAATLAIDVSPSVSRKRARGHVLR
jgi:hypothetical protein